MDDATHPVSGSSTRFVVWVALAAALVFVITWAALLTNLFRNPLSLEDAFVLVPLLVLGVCSTAFHGFILARDHIEERTATTAIAVTLAVVIVTVVLNRQAHGTFLPRRRASIFTNGDQEIVAAGGTLRYRVELVNPFSNEPRARLVLAHGTRIEMIPLPLFEARDVDGIAFAQPSTPSDWAQLEPTEQPNVYLLSTRILPSRPARFLIDVHHRTAVRR